MATQPRGPITPARLAAIAGLFLGGTLVSACQNEEEQEVYCVDRGTNQVIDPDYCEGDDGGSSFFYWISSPGHSRGYVVPANSRGSYINPKSSTARTNAGLPATGKAGGTKITGGGIGNGGGTKGGSSGG